MDTMKMERSYDELQDYHPSRGGLGFGLEPSTLISMLAFLAFLLHALLILLIPTLKSFFAGPLFGYGYANNAGIGYGNGFNAGFGSGPGTVGGFGGHGGYYGAGGASGFGYGTVPSILGGVNGILGTGLLGTTNLLGTGLSGLFGPGVATVGASPVAAAATGGAPVVTRVRSRVDDDRKRWQSEDKQITPASDKNIDEPTGRNINANRLLLHLLCNFYFCSPGKIKFT